MTSMRITSPNDEDIIWYLSDLKQLNIKKLVYWTINVLIFAAISMTNTLSLNVKVLSTNISFITPGKDVVLISSKNTCRCHTDELKIFKSIDV